jgi:hypothetical protein
MKIIKRLTVLSVSLIIMAGLLLSGCAKAEPSGFDLDGETLLFKGDENGKGTLYAGSTKVYEGEFVNGIIQGEGKLYDKGKLRYEGEFQNNMMLGSGILYSSAGKKMFEGVISENDGTTYQATGYLFNEDGKQSFYGDITVTGDTTTIGSTGVLFYPSGKMFYWGGFTNGEPDGNGTYYDEDGNVLIIE